MERPTKRPRLSFTPGSPEEAHEDWDLRTARAQNDLRLKSIFEGIFAKYGKDFTETGDEIDLETGKIVVDNGHLQGMREENDTGDKATWHSVDGDDPEEERRNLDEDTYGRQDDIADRSTQHDDLGVSETESDDSILGSVVKQPDSSDFRARPVPEVQTSAHFDKYPGTRDPLWQVPEIPRLFSTPTAESRHAKAVFSPPLPQLNREHSPPGSGSLWSIPRRGRPRTEGKPRATPSKHRSWAKVTSCSSPVVRDWSFAKTPDGDESDDPLQEFQPSPTPSKLTDVRVKSSNHLQSSLRANLEAARQSATQTKRDSPALGTKPRETEPRDNSQTLLDEEDSTRKQVVNHAASVQTDLPARSRSQADRAQDTPGKIYDGLTPDEARRLICMRYVQDMTWKEILTALPGRRISQVSSFNHYHWARRRLNPPDLSAPWSQDEMRTLRALSNQSGFSWSEIKAQFSGRSLAEIEFELLRLWVGDEVWFDEGGEMDEEKPVLAPNDETQHDEDPTEESPEPTASQRPLATAIQRLGPFTPNKKRPRALEEFLEDDDEDTGCSDAASPSKLSAILLDSPTHSRPGSRTPSRASPAKRVKLTF